MKRTWRRRNYFVKKDLQGKYIFSFFVFVIAGSVIFTLIFSLLSANTLTIVYENYNVKIGKTPLILIKEILSAHWIFLVTAGMLVVALSMFLTHRFAGPLYRLEKSVEEMTGGDFSFRIRLRKKDEGKELAEGINQLISSISSNIREMRSLLGEIDTLLDKASQTSGRDDDGKQALEEITKAKELTERLHDILSRFRTENER
jgi:methyl-accepting chemotaxis protein